jgi:hypothetical protein
MLTSAILLITIFVGSSNAYSIPTRSSIRSLGQTKCITTTTTTTTNEKSILKMEGTKTKTK